MNLKRSLLLFFVSLFIITNPLCTFATETVPDDEEDPYFILCEQADQAIADNNFEEAIARINDALIVKPDASENILLLSNLGMLYSYIDQDSLAIVTFDKALSKAPAMSTIISNRARVLLKMGRNDEAYAEFERLISIDSLSVEPRYYHGILSIYAADFATAEKDFKILKQIEPSSIRTATALTLLYTHTGRTTEAIPYLQKLIATEPSSEYYYTLSMALIDANRLSDASSTLAEAIESYPNDPMLYYCRARLNIYRYHHDEAKKDAAQAVKLGLPKKFVDDLFK